METRTYEFYKVGFKAPGETEYTFYNEPYLLPAHASANAQKTCRGMNVQTCVARFQIVEVNKPENGDKQTLAEKIADDIRNGTFGKVDKT